MVFAWKNLTYFSSLYLCSSFLTDRSIDEGAVLGVLCVCVWVIVVMVSLFLPHSSLLWCVVWIIPWRFPCGTLCAGSWCLGGESSSSLWQTASNSKLGSHCRPVASGVLAAGPSLLLRWMIRLLNRLYDAWWTSFCPWEIKKYKLLLL